MTKIVPAVSEKIVRKDNGEKNQKKVKFHILISSNDDDNNNEHFSGRVVCEVISEEENDSNEMRELVKYKLDLVDFPAIEVYVYCCHFYLVT